MGCPCKNKNRQQQNDYAPIEEDKDGREAAQGVPSEAIAPEVNFAAVVRDDGVPLACARCLEKHLCRALVYAIEAQEKDRPIESGLYGAHLMCAAEHARALGDNRAERIAAIANDEPKPDAVRGLLPSGGDDRESAIGHLGAAEDLLRAVGENESAERIREVRISIQNVEKKE